MRAAIIGLGKQNMEDHIPALLQRGVEISVVCDPLVERIRAFGTVFPVITPQVQHISHIAQLRPESFDFAIVSVPHDQYPSIVQHLVSVGRPFLKEKPLARTYDEARQLAQIKEFKRYCFICTKRRFDDLYSFAKDALPQIGTPFLINATYKLNIEDPSVGWRGDRLMAGGGCIVDMGYHIIDQLLWWFGVPNKVFATASSLAVGRHNDYAEDSASIAFRYNSGLHGTLLLSRTGGTKTEEFMVHGSDGHIIITKQEAIVKNKKGEVVITKFRDADSNPTANQLDFFISRLQTGKGFADVIDNNLRNMQFINKCYRSAYGKV